MDQDFIGMVATSTTIATFVTVAAQLANNYLERRSKKDEGRASVDRIEADSVSILTGASIKLVQELQRDNADLREKLDATVAELEQERKQRRALAIRVTELERALRDASL